MEVLERLNGGGRELQMRMKDAVQKRFVSELSALRVSLDFTFSQRAPVKSFYTARS